jgi:streptogrisin C
VKIRTVNGTVNKQAVRGSGNLQYNCTAGFIVQNGTRKGPLTSAHCLSSYDYYDLADGTAYTISGPSTAARNDASHDVRWLDATAYALPQFYADTATPRVLTGRRTQSNTAVGSTVCHRGIGSNYSCGSVESIAYTPTKPATATSPVPYYCGTNNDITCANTWVQVGSSSLRCAGGDSGGPWFSSTIALGVHTGGVTDASGYCVTAWYMSTDRISTGLGSTYSLIYG